jgi:hypothetical protein
VVKGVVGSTDWIRRYVISVPLIGFCHYAGSIFWLVCGPALFWNDHDNSALIAFLKIYFFPIGLNRMGGANPYLYLSIINAAFWAICITMVWHVSSSIVRILNRMRGPKM